MSRADPPGTGTEGRRIAFRRPGLGRFPRATTAAGGLPKRGLGGVSPTRTHRSLSIEVSLRSFDSVVRIVRSQPMASALSRLPCAQGTVGGSGRSAGAFGWSLRPMLGEGVPLSGPIRGQTRPRPVPCARAISGAFSGRLQDDAAEYAEGGGPRHGGRRCAAEASAEVLCSARLRTPWGGRWRCGSIRVIE